MESYTLLKPVLSTPRSIVITTHHKPDWDARGSSLALYHYLLLKGHSVHVVTPSDYPYFLHWLPGNSSVIVYPEQQKKAEELVKMLSYSLVWILIIWAGSMNWGRLLAVQ